MAVTVSAGEIVDDPELLHAAQLVLAALGAAKGGKAGDPAQVNVSRSVQALLFAAALMIDLDASLEDEADLARASGDAGRLLNHLLLALRTLCARDGAPLIERLGLAADPVRRDPGPRPRRH